VALSSGFSKPGRTNVRIFGTHQRTDRSAATQSEFLHHFLDRSVHPVFAAVRDLLEDWLSHVPADQRPPLIGAFRSKQDRTAFASAFWELYLHELYMRSGYTVTIHPSVPASRNRPDFLIAGHGERFYLEAVQVGTSPVDLAERSRLGQAHDVLNTVPTTNFSVSMSTDRVGPRPLATRRLRDALRTWLAGLDAAVVAADLSRAVGAGEVALNRLPLMTWRDGEWVLHFHALPLSGALPAGSTPMVGMYGPARAGGIDKHTGLSRALDSKVNKYGQLDAPLVIAVLDNTEPRGARDYEIGQSLYGLAAGRPGPAPPRPEDLAREGHWVTKAGWRRGHAPQVITASDFNVYNVTGYHPRLWETLEPGRARPAQPPFLARMALTGSDPVPLPAGDNPFGLPDGWPGPVPDYD
jgi:hypothetical protein